MEEFERPFGIHEAIPRSSGRVETAAVGEELVVCAVQTMFPALVCNSLRNLVIGKSSCL